MTVENDDMTAIFRPTQITTNNLLKTLPMQQPKASFFLDETKREYLLTDEISQIEHNYYQLRHFLITPAVIQYNELAQLRQRTSNAEVNGQLRLVVELLRLGRRTEAVNLMQNLERRLPLNNQQTAVYQLRLALVQAVSGDYSGAALRARQLLPYLDEQQGRQMLLFFTMVSRHLDVTKRHQPLLNSVEDELSA